MPSNNPKLTIRITPAQLLDIQNAVKDAGIPQAEWLRKAIGEMCKAQSVPFTDDYPTHGGNRCK